MNLKQLVKDLEHLRKRCSDKLVDLDEVDEELDRIIDEIKLSQEYKKR